MASYIELITMIQEPDSSGSSYQLNKQDFQMHLSQMKPCATYQRCDCCPLEEVNLSHNNSPPSYAINLRISNYWIIPVFAREPKYAKGRSQEPQNHSNSFFQFIA